MHDFLFVVRCSWYTLDLGNKFLGFR